MSTFSRVRVELFRIFHSPVTLLVMALTVLCPLAGYGLYQPVEVSTTAAALLANPALAGGLGGAFLFAVLTLYELNRVKKNGMEPLTNSILSPLSMYVVKTAALAAAALAAALITLAVYLPYTVHQLGPVFFMDEFLNAFGNFMFPNLFMGILSAGALYQVFRRVDLSFVCFTALALFSLSKWCSDLYLMRWINPLIFQFSTDFGNTAYYRFTAYSRLVWLALFGGGWLLSLLCVRVYGKGLFRSFFRNLRKAYLPAAAALLLAAGILLYGNQPFVDRAPLAQAGGITSGGLSVFAGEGGSQEAPDWRVLSNKVSLWPDVKTGKLLGQAVYQLENPSGRSQECVMNINPGYEVESVLANGEAIPFTDSDVDAAFSQKDISFTLPSQQEIHLMIVYSGSPQISASSQQFMTSGNEITPRFVRLSGNAIEPKFSIAVDCPMEGEVTLPGGLEVVSMGAPAEVVRENQNGTKTWRLYSAGGRLLFYAGDYVRVKVEDAGFPLYFYYSRAHQAQMEALGIQEIVSDTVAYCSRHYGALPFTEEEPLQLVMDSAHSMGGGANGNISYMAESVFTEESMSDPLKGAGAAEVIAHEIVHQWWGVSRFVMDPDDPAWSAEALTTYTTYRMMKEKHGEEYAQKYYVDVWNAAVEQTNQNFYLRNPQYQSMLPEKYLNRLQMSVADRNLYSKAPLQVLRAERLIGGEAIMDKVLSRLFQNGGTETPPYVTRQDFLDACHLSEEQLADGLTASVQVGEGNSDTSSTYVYNGGEPGAPAPFVYDGSTVTPPDASGGNTEAPAPFVYDGSTVTTPDASGGGAEAPAPFVYDGSTVTTPDASGGGAEAPAPFVYDGSTVTTPGESGGRAGAPAPFNGDEHKEETHD